MDIDIEFIILFNMMILFYEYFEYIELLAHAGIHILILLILRVYLLRAYII